MHSIHWEAHAQAIKRTSVPHTHLVKLLHSCLPTHSRVNKFDGGSRKCPACASPQEDFHHILHCPYETRVQWRRTFLRDLRDHFLRTETSPSLSHLLMEGLRQWFSSLSEIQLQPDAFHPSLKSIIQQQNKIGWSQIFLGRFCTSWASHQQGYLVHLQRASLGDTKTQSVSWQTNLIKFVWERWYTLWKQRNQEVHGHDATARAEAARREVRRKLNDIYRNRTMYYDHVQTLLLGSVEDHDAQSIKVTQNWLTLNTPSFRASYLRVKQRALRGMRSIKTYFGVR